MIEVDINRLLPKFLLADKNGHAMAKALERGLRIFCQTVQDGIETTLDAEKMPEWRLDEMAWELGCLYDYNASISSKRAWIRDAVPLYAGYGTVAALYKYLEGYFDDVMIEENWQYGGEPYHFRITLLGELDDQKETWARLAVESIKNVRSVLDDIAIGSVNEIKIKCGTDIIYFPYEMTGHKICGFDEL